MNYCLSRLVCLNLRATVRRDSLLIRMALCALFPLLLDACGVTDYRPYPYFDQVKIVADSVPVDMPLAKSNSDMAKDLPKNAARGAAASAGAGLAVSLLCGLLFVECATTFVPAGLVEGAIVGAGVSILMGMPDEEAEQVNDSAGRSEGWQLLSISLLSGLGR